MRVQPASQYTYFVLAAWGNHKASWRRNRAQLEICVHPRFSVASVSSSVIVGEEADWREVQL